jgi:hypothetical protein
MIAIAGMHRCGRWFVGLFLVAQIFGVVPLMGGHAAHVAETELAISYHYVDTGNATHFHHHRGDADGFIQHHELQDLSGALTGLGAGSDIAFVGAAMATYAPGALVEADPVLLERPPKPILSV